MLQKTVRLKDSAFLAEVRKLPCLACAKADRHSDAHHVRSRGAGGGDDWFNVIPLCSDHHTGAKGWHKQGVKTFLQQHPHVFEHLKRLGWELIGKNLHHPLYQQAFHNP